MIGWRWRWRCIGLSSEACRVQALITLTFTFWYRQFISSQRLTHFDSKDVGCRRQLFTWSHRCLHKSTSAVGSSLFSMMCTLTAAGHEPWIWILQMCISSKNLNLLSFTCWFNRQRIHGTSWSFFIGSTLNSCRCYELRSLLLKVLPHYSLIHLPHHLQLSLIHHGCRAGGSSWTSYCDTLIQVCRWMVPIICLCSCFPLWFKFIKELLQAFDLPSSVASKMFPACTLLTES